MLAGVKFLFAPGVPDSQEEQRTEATGCLGSSMWGLVLSKEMLLRELVRWLTGWDRVRLPWAYAYAVCA